ncbi:hypothetical protein BOX15_Mlig011172g3, partial [Macrostomum lignano]
CYIALFTCSFLTKLAILKQKRSQTMAEETIETPDNLSEVSVSVSNSRPSTAAKPEASTTTKAETESMVPASDQEKGKKKSEVVEDPYFKAMDYLEEHNIIQFFQKLTTAIVFERPADPVQYIVDKAEEVAESLSDEQLKKFYKKS